MQKKTSEYYVKLFNQICKTPWEAVTSTWGDLPSIYENKMGWLNRQFSWQYLLINYLPAKVFCNRKFETFKVSSIAVLLLSLVENIFSTDSQNQWHAGPRSSSNKSNLECSNVPNWQLQNSIAVSYYNWQTTCSVLMYQIGLDNTNNIYQTACLFPAYLKTRWTTLFSSKSLFKLSNLSFFLGVLIILIVWYMHTNIFVAIFLLLLNHCLICT